MDSRKSQKAISSSSGVKTTGWVGRGATVVTAGTVGGRVVTAAGVVPGWTGAGVEIGVNTGLQQTPCCPVIVWQTCWIKNAYLNVTFLKCIYLLKYRIEISIVLARSVSANRSDNALLCTRTLDERSLSRSNDYGRDSWRLSCNWWWCRSSNLDSGWSWRLSSHDDGGWRRSGEENVHFRIFLSINREIKRMFNWSIFVKIVYVSIRENGRQVFQIRLGRDRSSGRRGWCRSCSNRSWRCRDWCLSRRDWNRVATHSCLTVRIQADLFNLNH